MSARTQAKVLRALQSGEIEPVGARTTVTVDVRVVAATHRDLLAEIEAGRFREDLFYRLNVVPVSRAAAAGAPGRPAAPGRPLHRALPPAENNYRPKTLTGEATRQLQAMPWRGNVP